MTGAVSAGQGDGRDRLHDAGLRGVLKDEVAADGNHQGGGSTLKRAGGDEGGKGGGKAAEERGGGECDDGGDEDFTRAEPVGEPSREGNERRHGEEVDGEAGADGDGVGVEGGGHLGQRGRKDGAVEELDEEHRGDEDRDGSRTFLAGRRRLSHPIKGSLEERTASQGAWRAQVLPLYRARKPFGSRWR